MAGSPVTAATTPPARTGPWPSGWDDPRFASNVASGVKRTSGTAPATWRNLTIVDTSGEPAVGWGNYQLIDSRIRSREGPRVGGDNILIDGCYIECTGVGPDHADGIQAYVGSGGQYTTKNIVIRNTKIVMTPGSNNAGIFFADGAGAELTLENVYVDGDGAPNGAIWLPNTASDLGCRSLIARNVVVTNTNGRQGLSLDPRPDRCDIIEWTNVRWADGTPIPRPGRIQAHPDSGRTGPPSKAARRRAP